MPLKRGEGIAQPQSLFPNSCVCERSIYPPKSVVYNSVLKIRRLHSFISWNTLIGTRHLYWILTGPSFAVWNKIQQPMEPLISMLPALSTICNHPKRTKAITGLNSTIHENHIYPSSHGSILNAEPLYLFLPAKKRTICIHT